jgi:signal transduction histidine kinase
MESFTKDFLKFAKPADPIFSLVNPTDSLAEVIQLLKPRLKKNSIQLIDNATSNKALVMADVGHLKQLYMNIILNAVEVMPKNGQLTIDASIVSNSKKDNGIEQSELLQISFSDSGPGIPEAIMKTLFEPFIRGSEQGVGLGLSISQGIATSHGGWISAENKVHEKGAIFHIFLPIKS